nr:MAG TPA: hypothetical protein [Caudoviricetes sp.]
MCITSCVLPVYYLCITTIFFSIFLAFYEC